MTLPRINRCLICGNYAIFSELWCWKHYIIGPFILIGRLFIILFKMMCHRFWWELTEALKVVWYLVRDWR